MDKINVKTCTHKKSGESNGKEWTIYEVETIDGKKYDTFKELSPGEHEGVIEKSPNPAYNDKFKIPSGGKKGGFQKDYTFEKKRVALECATKLVSSGHIEMKNLTEARDKFFDYLNS